jgi:thiol-disulfide isomerase/thioredoxin
VKKRALWIGFAVLLVAVAIAATRLTALQGRPPDGSASGKPAPEFAGIDAWINSPPLAMSALRGKVVWIDFWTYSCINCVRTLPAVRAFYARYKPFGLEVVGVHSPEFDFEKKPANVRAAVSKLKIPYPVALDGEMDTWRAYGNSYWPRVYLVDATGRIRYDHAGEGGDDDIERNLRALLEENGAHPPAPLDLSENQIGADITPEIYVGFARGSQQGTLGNPEGYAPDATVDYAPVSSDEVARAGTRGIVFLEGRWIAQDEYVEAAADGAKVILPFRARNAYMVASASGAPVRVSVEVDGVRAADLTVGADDLYSLVSEKTEGDHVVTLVASKGFRLYTFTFG